MAGSFSLIEKVALAGAFCALVAMAVGTERDPGVLPATQTRTAQAAALVVEGAPRTDAANPWRLGPGAAPGASGQALAPPPPRETLPPGFGATPSPDLPQ